MGLDEWRRQFEEMAASWSAISHARGGLGSAHWPESFDRIRGDYLGLVEDGRWTSGPRDLMTVLGATDDEVSHSRVVAWLLQPTGRHGLGSRLLARILMAGWPAMPLPDLGEGVVTREVPRDDSISATRADVIVTTAGTVLVIENKVWADESPLQCEALYRHWKDTAPDVRFLLLSRDGHLPRTAKSPEARAAWRAVSYGQVAGLLAELASKTDSTGSAGTAVHQYRVALQRLVGEPSVFSITTRDEA